MTAAGSETGPAQRKRRRTRLVVLALSTLAVLLVGEFALRWILFGSSNSGLARRLRQAEWYTPGFDVDYWKLQAVFAGGDARPPRNANARLGWTGSTDPVTFANPDEAQLGVRTPVLLYGDSFAECVVPVEECWGGLLERSEFAGERALVNYGVGGYGLDQIALMIEASLPRFEGRDPTVLVGIFVDDDLARCESPIRGWVKPYFAFEGGEFVLHEPGLVSVADWSERNPPGIVSYLGRLVRRAVLGGDAFDPTWVDERVIQEQSRVCRAILERILATLDRSGVQRRAFLIFDGEASIHGVRRAEWQRELVLDFARENDVPVVSTLPFLRAAIDGDSNAITALMTPVESFVRGHYGALGNRVAFEAFVQALHVLDGETDDGSRGILRVRAMRAAGEIAPESDPQLRYMLLGHAVAFRGTRGASPVRVRETFAAGARISLRPGRDRATEVTIDLLGARRFTAVLSVATPPGMEPGKTSLRLVATSAAGGEQVFECAPGAAPRPLVLDVAGDRMQLRVDRAGEPRDLEWIVLEEVEFHGP